MLLSASCATLSARCGRLVAAWRGKGRRVCTLLPNIGAKLLNLLRNGRTLSVLFAYLALRSAAFGAWGALVEGWGCVCGKAEMRLWKGRDAFAESGGALAENGDAFAERRRCACEKLGRTNEKIHVLAWCGQVHGFSLCRRLGRAVWRGVCRGPVAAGYPACAPPFIRGKMRRAFSISCRSTSSVGRSYTSAIFRVMSGM